MPSKPAAAPGVALFFLKYDAPYAAESVHSFPKRSADKLIRYGVARLATAEERAKA